MCSSDLSTAYGLVGGHGAQNVDELAHAHGGGKAAFVAAQLGMGANLDFQIAGGELDAAAFLFQQHVGQHGQRVAALHDARHRLQGGQELVLDAPCGQGRLRRHHKRTHREYQ